MLAGFAYPSPEGLIFDIIFNLVLISKYIMFTLCKIIANSLNRIKIVKNCISSENYFIKNFIKSYIII